MKQAPPTKSSKTIEQMGKLLTSSKASRQPVESTADFKARICAAKREQETGKKYSVVGGPRAHESVVRPSRASTAAACRQAEELEVCQTCGNRTRTPGDDGYCPGCANERMSDEALLALHDQLRRYTGQAEQMLLETVTAELVSRGYNHVLDSTDNMC